MSTTTTSEKVPEPAEATQTKPLPEIAESPQFLLRIAKALANMEAETTHWPQEKLKEGDKPLRVITNPALRGLYALMVELERGARQAIPSTMPRRASERMAVHETLEEFSRQINMVAKLFWLAVRDGLGEDEEDNLSLREGWTVVAHNGENSHTSIRSLVQGLVEKMREEGFEVLGSEAGEAVLRSRHFQHSRDCGCGDDGHNHGHGH